MTRNIICALEDSRKEIEQAINCARLAAIDDAQSLAADAAESLSRARAMLSDAATEKLRKQVMAAEGHRRT